jgi:hypothetical protein
MAYAAFQELATRISHRNTGRYSDDPVADKIMVRVAADENLHMMFYRDIVAAALQVDPSAAVQAITGEVLGFDMPGVGIEGFTPLEPVRPRRPAAGGRPSPGPTRGASGQDRPTGEPVRSQTSRRHRQRGECNRLNTRTTNLLDDQLVSTPRGYIPRRSASTGAVAERNGGDAGASPPGYRRWRGCWRGGWGRRLTEGTHDGVWADTPLQAIQPPRTGS